MSTCWKSGMYRKKKPKGDFIGFMGAVKLKTGGTQGQDTNREPHPVGNYGQFGVGKGCNQQLLNMYH